MSNQRIQIQRAVQRAVGTLLDAATGPFNLAILKLFANNITPTPDTPDDAFVEPTFTGYAPVAAQAFAAAYNNPLGGVIAQAPSVQFTCTGGLPVDTIYGWMLWNTADDTLLSATLLDEPVPVTAIGNAVVIEPQLTFAGY